MSESTLADVIRRDGRYAKLLVVYWETDVNYLDLSPPHQNVAMSLLLSFLAGGLETQVEKLLLAVKYWGEGDRITWAGPNRCTIRGDHGFYHTELVPPRCDCPLFRGTGKFIGHKGMCAHLMLALICSSMFKSNASEGA